MTQLQWFVLVFVLVLVIIGHGIYSFVGASRARDALDEASDSIATLIDARVPLEMRGDSLRLIAEEHAERLRADSVRWASEIERANVRRRLANTRAASLTDSIRVRVDSATAELVDSLVGEHGVEVEALTGTVAALTEQSAALRVTVASLTELLAVGDDLEASLRAEIAQQAIGIDQLQRLVRPPFSLRFFRSAKVGIPAVALGLGIGFLLGG